MTKEAKPAEKPEAKVEAKADKRGDPHDRINALYALLRANGISVPD